VCDLCSDYDGSIFRPRVLHHTEKAEHDRACGARLAPCALCIHPHTLPLSQHMQHYVSMSNQGGEGVRFPARMLLQRVVVDLMRAEKQQRQRPAQQHMKPNASAALTADSIANLKTVPILTPQPQHHHHHPTPPPPTFPESVDPELWREWIDVPMQMVDNMRRLLPLANSLHVTDAVRITRFLAGGRMDPEGAPSSTIDARMRVRMRQRVKQKQTNTRGSYLRWRKAVALGRCWRFLINHTSNNMNHSASGNASILLYSSCAPFS